MIDVLVVGAGPSGLCAAKTLLQYDGNLNVVLVDAHATLGGVWSKEQLYPTLKTNNLFGTLDFTDFPMDQRFGIRPGQHVTGEAMHAYLAAYAAHFDLTRRIRFGTRVVDISRGEAGQGWRLQVTSSENGDQLLECAQLIVATGVLSVPNMPQLLGAADFDAPIIHGSEMGPRADEVLYSPDVKTVGVLGGGKSAYDAVYLAASTGHKVEWVVRRSGRGPVWVFPTHAGLGPFKAWREKLVTRRIVSLMSPCVWPDFSGFAWLRNFLHFSAVGRAVAQLFWGDLHQTTLRDCGYRKEEKLKVLEPEQNPFWYGTASGTLNYDKDIFSYVRSGQVQIHREDISHLSDHCVHLVDGTELSIDALIAATGFSAKPTVSFSPPSLHSDLGVPSTGHDQQQRAFWADLDLKADLAIAEKFPRLVRGPFLAPDSDTPRPFCPGMAAEADYTPWRLYRGVAPPGLTALGDRSLAFVGMFSNIANTTRLEAQCLWALAFLRGRLLSLDADVVTGRVCAETALSQRFARHRAPYGHGAFYPDLVFDQLPYWDTLLHDLGLRTARKGSMLKELFEPYGQDDYRGIVDEWIQGNR